MQTGGPSFAFPESLRAGLRTNPAYFEDRISLTLLWSWRK
jgi:hypothetical protein